MYEKRLLYPIALREAALVGFIRFDNGVCLCIFENGEVVKVVSEGNIGVQESWPLELNFDKANMTVYDSEH